MVLGLLLVILVKIYMNFKLWFYLEIYFVYVLKLVWVCYYWFVLGFDLVVSDFIRRGNFVLNIEDFVLFENCCKCKLRNIKDFFFVKG